MSAPKADELAFRGVYGVFDGSNLVYVGSTSAKLLNLENNHRKWREKGYSKTFFREELEKRGQNWNFVWLVRPELRKAIDVETIEGTLIVALEPTLNKDKDPVQSSIRYGRY